jgi:hypothetical protein
MQELHARITDIEARFNSRTDRLLSATESLLTIVQSPQNRLDKIDGGQL